MGGSWQNSPPNALWLAVIPCIRILGTARSEDCGPPHVAATRPLVASVDGSVTDKKGGTMRKLFVLGLLTALASPAAMMLATAGIASAQPPTTGTEVSTFFESFSDEPFVCQDELYEITVSGRVVVHFTYFEETGAVHFREFIAGKSVGIPLDGTGPTYTGTFEISDSENIRAVKNGDVLVETDTDMNRVVAHGSDGSRAFLDFHAHFTVNANGEMSVEFDTIRMVCT
jgi:hypothetical protein